MTVKLYLLSISIGLVVFGVSNQVSQLDLPSQFRAQQTSLPVDARRTHNTGKGFTQSQRQATTVQDTTPRDARPFRHVVSKAAPQGLANTRSSSCPESKPLSWDWHRYSSDVKSPKRQGKKRLLIGLSCGYDAYARLLGVTGRINKAYAKKFAQDVVVLQGTYLVLPSDECNPPGRRATFNKIGLLKEALRHRDEYDQLLILDTDAMISNMDFDITTLIEDGSEMDTTAIQSVAGRTTPMLVAHRVKVDDVENTWDVNIGVTLWNLQHPRIKRVVKRWEKVSRNALEVDGDTGDQSKLHAVLKNETNYIRAVEKEFAYGHGTVIRHYIRRRANKQWKDPNVLETRIKLLQEAADQVCLEFPSECQAIDADLDL